MSSLIKHPKDFYAGLMYASIGAGVVLIARDYNIGTSVRMGPGYFPIILGTLLILVGSISMIRSFFHHGTAIPRFVWRDIFLILGSVIVFGRMRVFEDKEKALHLARLLGEKFTQDKAYLDNEVKHAGPRMLMLELTPEYITGKRVNES